MPIKWTPEVDQILLLKILETSSVNADVKAISEAWPDNFERPTPRAITERLVKIRATSKSNGAISHFSVSNAKTGKSATGTPTGTPKKGSAKGGAKGTGTPRKNANVNGGAKRKRGDNDPATATDDSESEASIKPETTTSTTNSITPSKKPTAKAPRSKKPKADNAITTSDKSANEVSSPTKVDPNGDEANIKTEGGVHDDNVLQQETYCGMNGGMDYQVDEGAYV